MREAHFGKNWTWVNLKDTLADVDWQLAIRKREGFNTIAALTFHINYYVESILKVLQGKTLDSHDDYSFNHPAINNEASWQKLLDKAWADATTCAEMIEQLPDSKLEETFVNEKYGTYFRNFAGCIEHTHYHLGQIVILKKLFQSEA